MQAPAVPQANIGKELLNVPFPEMVKTLGLGIAEAQHALDKMSVRMAQYMSGFKYNDKGELVRDESSLIVLKEGQKGYSLMALGFTPTFYQFVDTIIEMKMAISMKMEREFSVGAEVSASYMCVSASVNASYSQKFQYAAEGSSLMRTKLVTVPAPAIFESRIKALVDEEEEARSTPIVDPNAPQGTNN